LQLWIEKEGRLEVEVGVGARDTRVNLSCDEPDFGQEECAVELNVCSCWAAVKIPLIFGKEEKSFAVIGGSIWLLTFAYIT
jgi:hypothetical protein